MEILESGLGPMLQPPDLEAFREWNRNKPKALLDKRMSEREAIQRFVQDGDYLGTELYGSVRAPMSLVRELIRQGRKGLRVAGQSVLEIDLLLGASMVTATDFTYIGLELYGVSNVLRREVEAGNLKQVVEWSNAGLAWRFKAAAMGVPFLPMRSMLGTDTFNYSAAKVVECPFTGKPVGLVPALILDVGLIHVHRADKHGNAQIDGISGFAYEMSRACRRLILSAEEIVDTDVIRAAPDRTIIPYYLVDAVVEAPFGSHPGEMCYLYERDEPGIKEWVEASKTAEGTRQYLDRYVYGPADHAAYLEVIGRTRLNELQAMVPGRGG
ncbi:MAG: CoA transferase subunit A [Chloroflexi bacterium]|nr:CoA transferase subunit A [Chloroflexota bacterium]